MYIESDVKLDFNNVLIKPKRSVLQSRGDVDLNVEYRFRYGYQWKGNTIPIMISNMDTTGTFSMAKVAMDLNIFTCIHKHYTVDDWIENYEYLKTFNNWYNYIAVSSGSKDSDISKLDEILNAIPEIKFICLDVANGYTEHFVSVVESCRIKYPNHVIIAGSVVTKEMTEELLLKGADIIKVGIGSGSVCTTRIKTAVGYPQLSAIIECADAAHGLKGHIIADGGCTCPGDFSKAFGGGADFVMSGGMFSGHMESGGKLIEKDGKKYKCFYGMSSKKAMEQYSGGVAEYKTSEGKEVLIEYKGSVKDTINDILGGIRSTCTYVGANSLKYLSKCTTFIRVTQQVNTIYGNI